MQISAYIAQEEKSELTLCDVSQEALGAEQIEVTVTHCGICHSDIYMVDNAWNNSLYPMVPSHEIAGYIK